MRPVKTFAQEEAERKAAYEARKQMYQTGAANLGTDKFGRLRDYNPGTGLYSPTAEMSDMAAEAEQGLRANLESRRGIVPQEVSQSEEYKSERRMEASNNATARRVIREVKRAQRTGRASNWLRRYAAAREGEFNSQNVAAQSNAGPQGSLGLNRVGSSDPPNRPPKNNSGTQGGIPSPPSGGTYVLGSVNGGITWIATTGC